MTMPFAAVFFDRSWALTGHAIAAGKCLLLFREKADIPLTPGNVGL
jgi:hypothetical protein